MRIGDPQAGQSRQAGRSTRSRSGGWRTEVLVIRHLPSGTEDPHHRTLPDSRLCRPSFLDGDQTKETPPTAEQINDTLNALRSRAKAPGSYDENDVIDLQAYFQKHFSGQRWLD